MHNNNFTGACRRGEDLASHEAQSALRAIPASHFNRQNYPLTTGRKAAHKSALNSESQHKPSFSRKLFSPQSGLSAHKVLSAGRGERLMDRFIPCRVGENLQAKFEAVSHKQEEESGFGVVAALGLLDAEEPRAVSSNE